MNTEKIAEITALAEKRAKGLAEELYHDTKLTRGSRAEVVLLSALIHKNVVEIIIGDDESGIIQGDTSEATFFAHAEAGMIIANASSPK